MRVDIHPNKNVSPVQRESKDGCNSQTTTYSLLFYPHSIFVISTPKSIGSGELTHRFSSIFHRACPEESLEHDENALKMA
jgi:hypothetical protein